MFLFDGFYKSYIIPRYNEVVWLLETCSTVHFTDTPFWLLYAISCQKEGKIMEAIWTLTAYVGIPCLTVFLLVCCSKSHRLGHSIIEGSEDQAVCNEDLLQLSQYAWQVEARCLLHVLSLLGSLIKQKNIRKSYVYINKNIYLYIKDVLRMSHFIE